MGSSRQEDGWLCVFEEDHFGPSVEKGWEETGDVVEMVETGGCEKRLPGSGQWWRGCVVIDLFHFFHKSKKQINMSGQRKVHYRYLMNGPFVSAANLGRLGWSQGGKEASFVLNDKKEKTDMLWKGADRFLQWESKICLDLCVLSRIETGDGSKLSWKEKWLSKIWRLNELSYVIWRNRGPGRKMACSGDPVKWYNLLPLGSFSLMRTCSVPKIMITSCKCSMYVWK